MRTPLLLLSSRFSASRAPPVADTSMRPAAVSTATARRPLRGGDGGTGDAGRGGLGRRLGVPRRPRGRRSRGDRRPRHRGTRRHGSGGGGRRRARAGAPRPRSPRRRAGGRRPASPAPRRWCRTAGWTTPAPRRRRPAGWRAPAAGRPRPPGSGEEVAGGRGPPETTAPAPERGVGRGCGAWAGCRSRGSARRWRAMLRGSRRRGRRGIVLVSSLMADTVRPQPAPRLDGA